MAVLAIIEKTSLWPIEQIALEISEIKWSFSPSLALMVVYNGVYLSPLVLAWVRDDAICGTSTGKLIYSPVDRFERIIPYKWDFSTSLSSGCCCCPKESPRASGADNTTFPEQEKEAAVMMASKATKRLLPALPRTEKRSNYTELFFLIHHSLEKAVFKISERRFLHIQPLLETFLTAYRKCSTIPFFSSHRFVLSVNTKEKLVLGRE